MEKDGVAISSTSEPWFFGKLCEKYEVKKKLCVKL